MCLFTKKGNIGSLSTYFLWLVLRASYLKASMSLAYKPTLLSPSDTDTCVVDPKLKLTWVLYFIWQSYP